MPPSDSPAGLDANTQALQALSQAVYNYESSFCVGGQISIKNQATQATADSNAQASTTSAAKSTSPVILHWTLPNEAPRALTLQFPVLEDGSETFNQLLQACDPATFGLGQKDVLDETYRKAGKLDNTQFSVSFHPADHGILDTITQTLLPNLLPNDKRADHRGVLAELYKLNVYSGPGGKFKAHVDTPRGETQFGSLVVCLPAKFEGGQLRVSHKGVSNFFDWGSSDSKAIQWAAFYSDCEHEIQEVTDGHRITLTYNLYFTQRTDATLQAFSSVDPQNFPFFKIAQAMLKNPDFLPEGGTIGYRCVHRYPHTSGSASVLMPHALKGLDCIFLAVFRALGLKTKAQPVLESDIDEDYGENYGEDDGNPLIGQDMLGKAFHVTVQGNSYGEELSRKQKNAVVKKNWPHERKRVHWLRGSRGVPMELAIIGLAYGNDASLDTTYSQAAIIVTIPKIGAEGRILQSD